MKHVILIFASLVIIQNLTGQKTELKGAFNSGLFSFSGLSSHATTSINWDDRTNSGFTNGPYGSKKALCYGFSFNVKRVTKRNFLFGIDLGYETLRSKISIDRIDGYTGFSTYQYSATGKTYLNSDFINLNPFLGYRIQYENISFDFAGGLDLACCLKGTENGNATASNGTKYSISADSKPANIDIRPRFQFSAVYKKFGLYTGYSYGILNYMMWLKGDGIWEAYSRLIRFGVTYQLN